MEFKYITFEWHGRKGKTDVWGIYSKSQGTLLGTIEWYGAWRQYCFFPNSLTVWNTGCLNDVCSFIKVKMQERNSNRPGESR